MNFHNCLRLLLIAASFASFTQLVAQEPSPSMSDRKTKLDHFIQKYETLPGATEPAIPRYSYAFVDLNDQGKKDVIVLLQDNSFCGSGGCTMLVLIPKKDSYKVIAQTDITHAPIRVLDSMSYGWHNLGVLVAGGGIMSGYEAVLSFNGTSYPTNPSVRPARHATRRDTGKVVIPANY
jgi:hypothetical protein